MKYGGYAGKVLEADLSREKVSEKELDERMAEDYLGGAGFCARVLYEEVGPETDPLGPSNVFVISTGPLTGTLFPQASRHVVAAKSPLTGAWGEAHAAGHWAAELKFSGYDMIIFRGKADEPVYLWIDDGDVKICDAGDLWGLDVNETDERLEEEHGSDVKQLYIGPAGENLVRFAAVMNDLDRAAARSGMGAVMGSKNLKAIAVRGSQEIPIAEPDSYDDLVDRLHEKMLNDPALESRAKYGTWTLVDLMNDIGRLPTRNFQSGVFEDADKLSKERLREHYLVKSRADFACLQRCGRYTSVSDGPNSYIGGGPEYEALCNMGSKCGSSDLETLLYAFHLCNKYGIDVCSCGGTIAWAMECYENGILTDEDTDGLELNWGNADAEVELVEKIARREGFGDLLAEGSYRAARKLGRGSEKYVMTVKKQEVAAQDGRAQKSMGLANATAARGADHLYGFPTLDESGFEEAIVARYGEEYMPEMADRLDPTYKGRMIKINEDFAIVVESLGVCKYGTMMPPTFFYNDLAEAMRITTGMDLTEADLRKMGEKLVNLNRMFNVREGITREDDTLPDRLLEEPAPEGPPEGEVVELDEMLDEYYENRGWRVEDGVPTEEKLRELNLSFTVDDLPS